MSDPVGYFIGEFRKLLAEGAGPLRYWRPRPYRNAAVRFRACSIEDFEGRRGLVDGAGLNVFNFPAEEIPGCDLLTDSGTTTMTMEQWASLMVGDESYGSSEGFFDIKAQVTETFGAQWAQGDAQRENFFIFHQGRAAEHAFFDVLIGTLRGEVPERDVPLPGDLPEDLRHRIESRMEGMQRPHFIIPSNSHFDTTEGNIEYSRMVPLNLPCKEHLAGDKRFPFRGNMDLEALEALLGSAAARVPVVYLTITNNTGGGQPVSMENITKIREITLRFQVPFFFDACRFAENAWFIQQFESGYRDKPIGEIVHEMFSHVDGFHISFKKDGLVNMGGGIVLKKGALFYDRYPEFWMRLLDRQILFEGHPTYGGLAGRDLKGLVEGLRTITKQEYLDYRVGQVRRFGDKLKSSGIPITEPIGGHAVYIDMDGFFDGTGTRDEDFKGIAFTGLMLIAGHRLCELGVFTFGKYVDGRELPPDPRVNSVRAAVPRLAYEDQDLFAAAEAIKVLYDNRDRIPGVEVEYGRELSLRHFKSRFRFKLQK